MADGETGASSGSISMYVFVNSDLGMSAGKIAAQVAHVAEKIAVEMMERICGDGMVGGHMLKYRHYLGHGHRKIILVATEKQMRELMKEEDAMHIIDEGYTEVPPDSLTVVGFFPSDKNKDRFRGYRLL